MNNQLNVHLKTRTDYKLLAFIKFTLAYFLSKLRSKACDYQFELVTFCHLWLTLWSLL